MSDTKSASSGGIGLSTLLLILFVYLKLTHQIGWSWFWVLSPAWIPLGVVVTAFASVLIVAALLAAASGIGSWRRRKARRLR